MKFIKPWGVELADGSFLYEFVRDDARFGISIERDYHSDSGWYYVNKNGESASGNFSGDLLKYLIKIFEE